MYTFLSLCTGAIIAIMVAINGELTNYYGMFLAAVIIHIIGCIFAFCILTYRKEKMIPPKGLPFCFYLGGALGVVTTFANNFAFGKISLTNIIAIGLLGQTICSLCIDAFGLWGMQKYGFKKYHLMGLSISFIGMFLLLDMPNPSGTLAIFISLIAGITVVLSRTCNANLSQHIGALGGSFINHVVGLPICVLLLLTLGRSSYELPTVSPSNLWIYLGGTLGVLTVLLFNLIVPKVTAVSLTLLTFIGQFFTSMVLDIVLLQTYDTMSLVAGVVIACGLLINMLLTMYSTKNNPS